MNDVMSNINSRRSVRGYTDQPLDREQITMLLECGVRAPNGCNTQPWRFVVITDREVMDRYSGRAKSLFSMHLEKQMQGDPPGMDNLRNLKRMMDDPANDIFHGAPCLILIFCAPGAMTPAQDSALCAQNMMLAAHSMGLGSLWVGFASPLGQDPETRRELGVPEDHTLQAQLVFGHPAKDLGPTPRKEPVVLKWI